ncbi:MAG: riboflavin kinase, partial [Candidatus Poribacteria bacterium]|nr:riboflavin kinase [Candidatus Poribacteria bacterium]
MKIFVDFQSIALTKADVAVTVGVFDGVHVGHQTVIQRLISKAKNCDLLTAVLIFDPSPAEYFQSSQHKSSLTDRNQKITIFEQLGLDLMVMAPFSSSIVRQSADEFLQEILIRQLGAKAVISGYDWQFGKGRTGNPRFLKSVGERHGVDIEIVAPRYIEGKPVHSTWIRKEVEKGDLNLVADLLGRKYTITGTVIKGDQRGRKIGFPTININTGDLV